MNKVILIAIAACSVLLVGCARFQHQTGPSEPHGLLKVVSDQDASSPHGVVEKIDGLPVSLGQEYRVTPGEHTVMVRAVETSVASYKPLGVGTSTEPAAELKVSQSGSMTMTGQQPLGGMQPVHLNVEGRRTQYVTIPITVEAGCRYELDGDIVTKKQF